jgi:hypothetical protein
MIYNAHRVSPSSQLVRPSWIAQLTLQVRRDVSHPKLAKTPPESPSKRDLHAAGEEYDERLERVEVKVERLADRPSEEDKDGNDEKRNLDRRADGDGETEVELVLGRDRDGLYGVDGQEEANRAKTGSRKLTVTCSAAFPTTGSRMSLLGADTKGGQLVSTKHTDTGERDLRDKFLADVARLGQAVDRVDQALGRHARQSRNHREERKREPDAQFRFVFIHGRELDVLLFLSAGLEIPVPLDRRRATERVRRGSGDARQVVVMLGGILGRKGARVLILGEGTSVPATDARRNGRRGRRGRASPARQARDTEHLAL